MFNETAEKYFSRLIEVFLALLIVFTPLFYGAVDVLPLSILQLTAFALFFLIFIYIKLFSQKIIYPAYIYFLIFFVFVGIFQLVPLLAALLKIISPKTEVFYERYAAYLGQPLAHRLSLYSLPTQEEIIKFIAYFIIFFAAMNIISRKNQFNRLFLIIIFLGLILAFYGVARKYFILGKETAGSFSTFGNRNHYAGYMLMIAPLAIGYAIYSENNAKRFIFGFIGAIVSASIFLSLSRAGSLSLIFSLVIMSFMLMREGKIKKTYWIIAAAAIFAIFLVSLAGFTAIRDRFMLFSQGLFGRFRVVRDSAGIFKDFPLFGIGWGNFRYVFPLYQKFATFPSYYKYLHNDHFQLVVEMGLAGAAVYFFFLCRIFWEIFSKLKERRDYFTKGVVLGGASGLLGVLFHSFFDFNFHIPAVSFLFWLLLGLIYKCVHTHFRLEEKQRRGAHLDQSPGLYPEQKGISARD